MGQKRLKWGDVERFCSRTEGFSIEPCKGGEKKILGPPAPGAAGRSVVVIGHTSCNSKNAEMLKCYESALKRAFGITRDMIKDE